ncbi:hypothetical protein [Pseudofrankia asymbiotica]|uniref:hypothetical protein n=1 Tax=Pseudofrankia asymbiotica TaxID=1834516 RepID=UPI0018E9372A|nr:hypothetical protein [Pseudofrankia asymbiotica]
MAAAEPARRPAEPGSAGGPQPSSRAGAAAGPAPAPPVDEARARLAARQTDLLAALVAGGPPPAGFDHGGLDATRRSLLGKRRAGVARRWPALAAEAGFAELFDAWAAGRPPAGSFHDGLEFARAHPAILSTETRAALLYGRAAGRRLSVIIDRPAGGDAEGGGTLIALRAPALGTLILRRPTAGPGGRPERPGR